MEGQLPAIYPLLVNYPHISVEWWGTMPVFILGVKAITVHIS
jgi:hypothetical protein